MCETNRPRPRTPVLNRSRRLLIDALPHVIRAGSLATALTVADYLAETLGMDAEPSDKPNDPDSDPRDPTADALAAQLSRAIRT